MKINALSTAKVEHSDFYESIDQLFIDGVQIGDIISNCTAYDAQFLIPTLSCEISSDWDREYIWTLLDTVEKNEIYIPLLMCCEANFSCFEHLVFVHIKKDAKYVYWMKFGIVPNPQQYWETVESSSKKTIFQVSSKTFEQIELSELHWLNTKQIYKFNRVEYEALIDYYRTTNVERKTLDYITDWLLWIERGYRLRVPRKYLYLSVEINKKISIQLSETKTKVDNYSEWNNWAEYKPKYRKLDIDKTDHIASYEDILPIIKQAINNIIKRYKDRSIINYSSEIFIGSSTKKITSIVNNSVSENIIWWWRLINFVKNKNT